MSEVFVTSVKQAQLERRMRALRVAEDSLVERFVLGSGKGGQKVNKTSSCVYLKHVPTGLEVKCQRTRRRELNRFLARRELCDRIEKRLKGEASRRKQEAERIRRQKRRRSRRQRQRILDEKRRHSGKKDLRKKVDAASGDAT